MEKMKLYIMESYNELVHKVTWPTMSELQSTTVVVLTGSVILALLIALMDVISNSLTSLIYNGGL